MNFHLATFTSEANRAINKHKTAGREREREWAAVFYIRFVYTFLHFPKQSFFSFAGLCLMKASSLLLYEFIGLYFLWVCWRNCWPITMGLLLPFYIQQKRLKRNRLARKVRLKISSIGKDKMQYEANFQFHLKHEPFLLSYCLKLIFCILYNTYILQDECTY